MAICGSVLIYSWVMQHFEIVTTWSNAHKVLASAWYASHSWASFLLLSCVWVEFLVYPNAWFASTFVHSFESLWLLIYLNALGASQDSASLHRADRLASNSSPSSSARLSSSDQSSSESTCSSSDGSHSTPPPLCTHNLTLNLFPQYSCCYANITCFCKVAFLIWFGHGWWAAVLNVIIKNFTLFAH